jgi:5'-phosphate synthase pdxT subunit
VTGSAGPVGVLALQGDFREHIHVLAELGTEAIPVRRPEEVERISGLIIPGGESSVMDKLSRAFGLAEPLKTRIAGGMPVYGTCAGLIMIADRVIDGIVGQESVGGLDVSVRRNAFGSQTASFEADLDVPALGEPTMHAVFIRAPVVAELGERATALARLDDGTVVAVQQGNLIGTSFHPEMTADYRFHQYFLDTVASPSSGR